MILTLGFAFKNGIRFIKNLFHKGYPLRFCLSEFLKAFWLSCLPRLPPTQAFCAAEAASSASSWAGWVKSWRGKAASSAAWAASSFWIGAASLLV